jgi:hypothetical protein
MTDLNQLIEWREETNPTLGDIENELDYHGINIPVEDFIKMCSVCGTSGWIYTFNTDAWIDEVQRCDHCKKINTDKEARAIATNAHNEFQYPSKVRG